MLTYTGIRVRDLERARRFYVEGLGLRVGARHRTATEGVTIALSDPESGAVLELNYYPDQPAYREGDELDHLAFQVDDVPGAAARLVELGGRVQVPVTEEDGGRLAFVTDPDGIWLKLFDRRATDMAPTSRPMD
jgi:catechol 2,3-dioxygenase-like lactoylglutathione lyase family enzyme